MVFPRIFKNSLGFFKNWVIKGFSWDTKLIQERNVIDQLGKNFLHFTHVQVTRSVLLGFWGKNFSYKFCTCTGDPKGFKNQNQGKPAQRG